MLKETERYLTAFHDRARVLSFAVYSDFKAAALHLDRQQEERAYLQLQEKHVSQLKLELHRLAGDVLNEYSPVQDTGEANRLLSRLIEEYKKAMERKLRSF